MNLLLNFPKDGVSLTDPKVKLKILCLRMPGMPYMEYEDKATLEMGVSK